VFKGVIVLRFICKNKFRDHYSGVSYEKPITLLLSVPELEKLLSSGGYGIDQGYDITVLDSVEIVKEEKPPKNMEQVEKYVEENDLPF